MQSDGKLITSGEVARRLGIPLRTVQRMAKTGRLPVVQSSTGTGSRSLFDAGTIDFIARQREQQAEAKSA